MIFDLRLDLESVSAALQRLNTIKDALVAAGGKAKVSYSTASKTEQEAMPDAAMHEFVSPRGNPIVRLSTAMHEFVIPRGNPTDHGPYMVSYRQLNQITCPRRHPHAAVNQVRETDSSANLTEP